jgi:hypothetical protein
MTEKHPVSKIKYSQRRNPLLIKSHPIKIGNALEPFFDTNLIDKMHQVDLQLHSPQPQEIVFKFDQEWEGNISGYYTIIKDHDLTGRQTYKLYYRGCDSNPRPDGTKIPHRTCYAESYDGITWTRPSLNIYDFEGSMDNNIIWFDQRWNFESFTPFIDDNPDCKEDERYKAICGAHSFVSILVSSDGIHWKALYDEPVLTNSKYDSQNVCFWDLEKKTYVLYHRKYHQEEISVGRNIYLRTSKNLKDWSEGRFLKYTDSIPMEMYTNAVQRYYRSPQVMIAFPNRFNIHRRGHPNSSPGCFDVLFMTSRDGQNWKRYPEAWFRPGPQKKRWATRNNMIALGLYETPSKLDTAAKEISVLMAEGYYLNECQLRRYTVRLDGFTSLRSKYRTGEIITKPLIFKGSYLFVNFSTSGIGWIRIELCNENKQALAHYTLRECHELFGDYTKRPVFWRDNRCNLVHLAGVPIRLRIMMCDADLYSIQFQ